MDLLVTEAFSVSSPLSVWLHSSARLLQALAVICVGAEQHTALPASLHLQCMSD